MVEIFDDRIEITNPGEPLVDTQRFVDTPPRSRNEAVAADSIIVEDLAVGTRARAYLPYWAAARSHPEEIA